MPLGRGNSVLPGSDSWSPSAPTQSSGLEGRGTVLQEQISIEATDPELNETVNASSGKLGSTGSTDAVRSRDLLSREENTNKASVEIHKIVSGQEGEERDSSKDDEFKNVDIDKIWDETTPALKHKWLWIVATVVYNVILVALAVKTYVTYRHPFDFQGISYYQWSLWMTLTVAMLPVAFGLCSVLHWLVNRSSTFRSSMFYYARRLRRPLSLTVWFIATFILWQALVYQRQLSSSRYDNWYVGSALISLAVLAGLFTLKQLVVNVMGRGYEKASFSDRIRDALFAEHVLDYLSSSLLSHGPDRPRTNSCDSTGSAEHSTHEQSPPTQKKWKDLLRIDRVFGSALRRVPHQAFETLIRFYSSRPLFGGAWLTKDEILDEANKLFDALTSQSGRKFFDVTDVTFLPYKLARKIVRLFDRDHNCRVYRRELQASMLEIHRERRLLARALDDSKSITRKLDHVLTIIVFFVFIFVVLANYRIDVKTFYGSLAGVILAYVAVFGPAAALMFRNVVFVLVVHPYDVGDVVTIDGRCLTVAEIQFTVTVFYEGSQLVYYPNVALINMPIYNTRRSLPVWDSVTVMLPLGLSVLQVNEFESRIRDFFYENVSIYDADYQLYYSALRGQKDELELNIVYKGYEKPQGSTTRDMRRTRLLYFIKGLAEELGVRSREGPRRPILLRSSQVEDCLQRVMSARLV